MNSDLPFSWRSKAAKRTVLILVVGLIALYGVLPNIHAFGLNARMAFPAHWPYLLAAVAVFSLTFVSSSFSYTLLALRKVRQYQLLLVQIASVPLNLLLPAGVGNLGFNYLFLRSRGHKRAEAGLVVGMNNIVGVFGNVAVLAVLLITFGVNPKVLNIYSDHKNWLAGVSAGLALLAIAAAWFMSSRIKLAREVRHHLLGAIREYRHRLHRLGGAFLCAVLQASVTGLAFWLTLHAYAIHLSYPLSFVIYGLSVMIGAIIPTPGGLGGVEATLTAGIVAAHGAATSRALAAVLAYRLISYWLPVIIGLVALFGVQRSGMMQNINLRQKKNSRTIGRYSHV